MLAVLHHSAPEVCLQRLQRLLAGGKTLPGRGPGPEVLGIQHVARGAVLQPVDVLQRGYIEAEESKDKGDEV